VGKDHNGFREPVDGKVQCIFFPKERFRLLRISFSYGLRKLLDVASRAKSPGARTGQKHHGDAVVFPCPSEGVRQSADHGEREAVDGPRAVQRYFHQGTVTLDSHMLFMFFLNEAHVVIS
jgi:hypothetical protein